MKIKIMALTVILVLMFSLCAYAEEAAPAEAAVETEQEQTVGYGELDEMIAALVSDDGVFRRIEYNGTLTEFDVYVDVQQYDPALDNSSLAWLYPLSVSQQSNHPENLTEEGIIVCIFNAETGELMDTLTYAPSDEWICPNCGQTAAGNYCSHCGTSKTGEYSLNLESVMQYIMGLLSQNGGVQGGANGSVQMTDVNDINTNINFYIYQMK